MRKEPKLGTGLASLKRALAVAVNRYRPMSVDELAVAAITLVHESGIEFAFNTSMDHALKDIAAQGSIDAVALSIAVGASEAEVSEMLGSLAKRSPDVVRDMAVEGLTQMMETFFEGEIAAGRMTKTRCPKTGDWLYQTAKK